MNRNAADTAGRTALLIGLTLTILIYIPGMTGGFIFDDYANILINVDIKHSSLSLADLLEAAWSGISGPLKRPIAMVSFALNQATTGGFVAAYKLTNLAIHLVNGVLLFVLLRRLLAAPCVPTRDERFLGGIAAVAAILWLVHPLNLTSVLYVVQRMNSLATLFSLAALICYVHGRYALIDGRRRGWLQIALLAPFFAVLGVLSKENAVLTLPFAAVIEVCFFRFQTALKRDRTLLLLAYVVLLVLPLVAFVTYALIEPEFLTRRFARRPFTMGERLLTEARVMWFYLGLALIPRLREFGIYHDDFAQSVSLFEPLSTAFAIAGLVIAVGVAAFNWRRRPLLAFGIAWYLVGHSLESTVVSLELVHEHRNYMPVMGVLFALSYYAATWLADTAAASRARFILAASMVVLLATVTWLRAGDWSDPVTLAAVEAERHPESFRAVYELGRIQFGLYKLTKEEPYYTAAVANLERAVVLGVYEKRALAALLKLEYARGNEPKPHWLPELKRRYEHGLFHPADSADLHQLVKCHARSDCQFPRDEVAELYYAALNNPSLPNYSRAQLMVDLAILYVNEAADLAPALALLDDAVALEPGEFGFRRTRAEVRLFAGEYAAVREEIDYMRTVERWNDWLNAPTELIDDLEQQLREAEAGPVEPR